MQINIGTHEHTLVNVANYNTQLIGASHVVMYLSLN